MKKLMSLGCLMALVLAGASAFAADWFTTEITTKPTGRGGSWTYTDLTLKEETGGISFNDWNHELVFSAEEAKLASNSNSIIKTTVKFTALDGSEGEVPTAEMTNALPAKAGLTIVEGANGEKTFWGIVSGSWVPLTGNATNALEAAVPVKIEIMKDANNGVFVQYTVDSEILTDDNGQEVLAVGAAGDFSVQSVSYKGNVQLLSSLVGYAYGNTGTAQEEVAVTETETIPATIVYDPLVLAARNVDVTDANAVKTYLTTTQTNGNLGWVNSTLGIADDQFVEIASNKCEQGSVTVDFGFAQDGNSTIKYVIDTANTNENAQIDTAESGIHTVAVQVTQGGKTVTVTNQQVGVMNTGKELTQAQKDADEMVYDIVAIPFDAFKGAVTVANVLNTAELKNDDMLYVLNKAANKYDTYKLVGGVWTVVGDGHAYVRGQAISGTTPQPDEAVLTPGQAVWIERHATSKIVFAGKGEVTENHIWEWTEGEYSLVANPTVNDFSLAGKTFGGVGDMIIVEDATNPQHFEKRADKGWGELTTTTETNARGKTVVKQVFTVGGTIKAGIGFWYYKADAGEKEPKSLSINFGKNVTE